MKRSDCWTTRPSCIDAEEIARLVERTEGWPIALQMTALSLRKGCDRADLLANFSGPAWELARYLSEQVLASLPADVASVVRRTPIVDRINADLVNLLCDRTDGPDCSKSWRNRTCSWCRSTRSVSPIVITSCSQRSCVIASCVAIRRSFKRLHRLAADWFGSHGMAVRP